ncbi:hypothetical protein ABZ354_02630 [Streptomyces sp. NPDC005925]|uniref:hypothetical protein n=1 Tax=Streptomyces sp. NPDC005925 TaxID=3157172 RepID=UPI0034105067
MRHSLTAAAFVAALALAVPLAAVSPARAGTGEVCFYTEPGYRGASWCYRPSGYADVPDYLHDRARSFESNSDVIVYGIDHGPGGHCFYRKIWVGDRSADWAWGGRIDGVATDSRGCEIS